MVPDGRRLVVVRSDGNESDLWLVDLESNEERRLPLPGNELFPHWSPGGDQIGYTSDLDAVLSLRSVRLDDGVASPLLDDPGRDVWPRWSPSGSHVAFFSRRDTGGADDEIYILDLETERLTRLTDGSGHDFCPAWSPDGGRVVFVNVQPDGSRWLQVVDRRGTELTRLGAGFHRVTEPAWSPDGRFIAFAARESEEQPYRIYIQGS